MKDTQIKEIMSDHLVTLSPYDTLAMAKNVFEAKNIHHIPVVHEDDLVGILSLTDLERSKQGRTLFIDHNIDKHNDTIMNTTLISMVMTEIVETISAKDTIYNAYQTFKQNTFRSLPVFDNGKLAGIITPMDFLDHLFREKKS